MEFKTQKSVDDYIKEHGFFTSSDKLFMKVSDIEWVCIDDRKERIISHIKNNTDPLTDLAVVFPTISLTTFANYEGREQSISSHIFLLEEIKDSKKFLNRKNWRLIRLEQALRIENTTIKYLIYDVDKRDYNIIKESFLNKTDMKSAYTIRNITKLVKLNKEDFTNKYKDAYEIELKRFEELGIYQND